MLLMVPDRNQSQATLLEDCRIVTFRLDYTLLLYSIVSTTLGRMCGVYFPSFQWHFPPLSFL